MRVLLLHTPMSFRMAESYLGDSPGLGYIASVLRRDGHEVEILDALLRDLKPPEILSEILAREYDCLGITANHDHADVVIPLVRELRKRRKDGIIMVGGYLPTLSAEDLLKACPEIDIAVRGEGEVSVPDLLGRIDRSEDWRTTPGIAYLQDGALVMSPGVARVDDLDSLPFPCRDGILQRAGGKKVRLVRIVGSRGCYYGRCSFCSIRAFHLESGHSAVRLRSPRNIADELEWTIASTEHKAFKFVDDDFIGPSSTTRAHALAVADELRARKLPITFEIECRADTVNEEVLGSLKEVGLDCVFLGIESGVQTQLDRYSKGTTVEQNRRAIEMIQNLGLRLTSGFISFDPYVTVGELAQNLQFLTETGLSNEVAEVRGSVMHKALSRLVVFPGAPIGERLRADGLLKGDSMFPEIVFRDRWVRLLDRTLSVLEFVAGLAKRLRRSW